MKIRIWRTLVAGEVSNQRFIVGVLVKSVVVAFLITLRANGFWASEDVRVVSRATSPALPFGACEDVDGHCAA